MNKSTSKNASTAAAVEPPARILRRRYYGQPYNTMLGQMLMQRGQGNKMLERQGWTGRRVLGYKLPTWQRPEVWSDDQCLRFLESIWLGVGLGSFMVNSSARVKAADQILLDGQQRLRAIERYFDDELAVTGEDGSAYHWSQLTEQEQAQFTRIPFPWTQTAYTSDAQLRDAYNRHNFGGVSHAEDQKA